MTTYLGALYHGEHAMAVHRDGRLIRWLLSTPGPLDGQEPLIGETTWS